MYKLLTISTLLLGLALAPFLSAQERQGPRRNAAVHPEHESANQVGDQVKNQAIGTAVAVDSGTCAWRCAACEPGQGCSQICTEIGECGTTCNMISRCNAGYVWDEASCSCID